MEMCTKDQLPCICTPYTSTHTQTHTNTKDIRIKCNQCKKWKEQGRGKKHGIQMGAAPAAFPAYWMAGMKAISIKMRLTAHKATHLPHLLRFPVNSRTLHPHTRTLTHIERNRNRSTMSSANDRLAGYRLKSRFWFRVLPVGGCFCDKWIGKCA